MAAADFSAVIRHAPGGTIDNKGTIAADGGGTITVYGFDNFSGGTLTGGTWEAAGTTACSSSRAPTSRPTPPICCSMAPRADPRWRHHRGAGRPDRQYRRRQPDLEGWAALTSPGAFSNSGSLTVGAGSQFTVNHNGNYTSAGASIIDGTLTAGTATLTGSLTGAGVIAANLVNNGAVTPGDSPGILTIERQLPAGQRRRPEHRGRRHDRRKHNTISSTSPARRPSPAPWTPP